MTIQINVALAWAVILCGLALVASVAVCLYSVFAMKKYRRSIFTEGYVQGLVDAQCRRENGHDAD